MGTRNINKAMYIEEDKFDKAIHFIGKKPLIYSLDDFNRKWLVNVSVPIEFIEFLNKYAFKSFVKFGQVTFNCPNEIKRENTEEENPSLIENGLLVIGSGLNGDPIVMDIKDGKIGYISHDEFWENEEVAISEVYIKMNESIGSFFLKSVGSSGFPVDYFEALEFEVKNV